MGLTFTEIESITRDYFLADGKKASDIYFDDSFILDYFMNKKKGLWERPTGGRNVRVPLSYDGQAADAYDRADALDSDDRESLNAAYFGINFSPAEWKVV